jgi:putative transposase
MEKTNYKYSYRRRLPHLQPKDSKFFITYRLNFSLPDKIICDLKLKRKEYEEKVNKSEEKEKKSLKNRYDKILFDLEDDFLAKYEEGPQWLKDDYLADMVIKSLLYNHEKQYELICALVMSNHVHIVIKPFEKEKNDPYSFSEILQNHKSYTGHKANEYIKREGIFWQHESYDHFIRNDEELKRIIKYILNNPVKAGLVKDYREWKHYWLNNKYSDFL